MYIEKVMEPTMLIAW